MTAPVTLIDTGPVPAGAFTTRPDSVNVAGPVVDAGLTVKLSVAFPLDLVTGPTTAPPPLAVTVGVLVAVKVPELSVAWTAPVTTPVWYSVMTKLLIAPVELGCSPTDGLLPVTA